MNPTELVTALHVEACEPNAIYLTLVRVQMLAEGGDGETGVGLWQSDVVMCLN